MTKLVEGLNKPQAEAVLHTEGPLLIIAGAGSGKTRVLTHRIAYLIQDKGVYPSSILSITFTNKAAKEMKERIAKLLGDAAEHMWVGTFHGICVRMLRKDIDKLGYDRSFVIYDTSDQQTVIKSCLKELNLNEKNFAPRAMIDFISKAKNELIEPQIYMQMHESDFKMSKVAKIYSLYQKKLKNNNAVDFDDIIMLTIKLLLDNPPVLDYYQRKFKYVLVDEYQDTNTAQYSLVTILAQGSRNLCVVGDDDQCLVEGTLIKTLQGLKPIEELKELDKVICASGRGEIATGEINFIKKSNYCGPIIKIETETGKVIKATPNHIGFSKLNSEPGVHYVYLMYKKGMGFRIGQTQGVRSRKGEIINGLIVRLNQEHGDKMWILRVCMNREEACFYEQLLSYKYGIPTLVFQSAGRSLAISQQYIDKLFIEIDTEDRVQKLMDELFIFQEYPHHISNAVIRGQTTRQVINITSFGGRKVAKELGWHSHRLCLNTSGEELKQKISLCSFPVRNGNRNTWRVETERADYDEADQYAKRIAQVDENLEIVKKARLTKQKSFSYMPFAHMKPTMSIAINNGDEIVEDVIKKVSIEHYEGYVYDLSIPHYRQYIAEGVVVHNSIYAWRGANIRNILDFEKEFKDCRVVKLEQNYRSTKTILNAANEVIRNNAGRKSKKLWTDNDDGPTIITYTGNNEHDEGAFVAGQIKKLKDSGEVAYKDIAVLYRMNAQSRVMEDMLMRQAIPYKIFGGLRFYDRKEIKDIIAYLRLVQNPSDDVALERIINVPKRGIGDTTVDKAAEVAVRTERSIFSVISIANEVPELARAAAKLLGFAELIKSLRALLEEKSVTELISAVIEKSGILKELQDENTVESETRIENIKELISGALDFEQKAEAEGTENTLSAYLEQVLLVTDIDKMDDKTDNVIMMTLHSAKGLEFPVVFMVGMEEGVFPGMRSMGDENELEEERRLCYVGMTRAMQKLHMTNAFTRTLFGNTTYNKASRFIREIPEELIDSPAKALRNTEILNGNRGISTSDDFQTSQQRKLPPNPQAYGVGASNFKKSVVGEPVKNIQFGTTPSFGKSVSSILGESKSSGGRSNTESEAVQSYKCGDVVEHKKFGVGTITKVEKENDDFKIEIQFKTAGMKRLMASFARLTKL